MFLLFDNTCTCIQGMFYNLVIHGHVFKVCFYCLVTHRHVFKACSIVWLQMDMYSRYVSIVWLHMDISSRYVLVFGYTWTCIQGVFYCLVTHGHVFKLSF